MVTKGLKKTPHRITDVALEGILDKYNPLIDEKIRRLK